MPSYPSKVILGVPIAAITLSEIPHLITNLIGSKGKKMFFYVNAHCLNVANKDLQYKRILQKASLVYTGGFGPVLASRILAKPLPERVPTPDFIFEVLDDAQEMGWSLYLLGGKEGIAREASEILKKEFPKLIIIGYYNGYFKDNMRITQKINRLGPDIILVGMGTPKQEKWIAENMNTIDAKIFWGVGALFDIISGRLKRAPRWMQQLGLEWLYRLFQEPKRLWKRYLFGNITFLSLILLQRNRNK